MTYRTSAAARAVALKLAAQYPDALLPAQVVRLPGVEPRYQPAVRLRHGASAPEGITDVMVLEAEPVLDAPGAKPTKVRAPMPPPVNEPRRPHRTGQRERAIAMLRRPDGASGKEMEEALGVEPHTVRSLVSRLRAELNIERGKDRRYRSAPSLD